MKTIFPMVKALSLMPNMKLWLSADAETGFPDEVPAHARVAWMQTEAGEDMDDADLVFLDHPLRKKSIPLTVIDKVCPAETPDGKRRGTTCATCRTCLDRLTTDQPCSFPQGGVGLAQNSLRERNSSYTVRELVTNISTAVPRSRRGLPA